MQRVVLLVGEVFGTQSEPNHWRWVSAPSLERAVQMLAAVPVSAVVLDAASVGDLGAATAALEAVRPEVPLIAVVGADQESCGGCTGACAMAARRDGTAEALSTSYCLLEAAVLDGCDDAILSNEVGCQLTQTLRKNIARTERVVRMRAALESRVAARTQALQDTNNELQAFTYAVSHDLREPLRSLEGFSLALLEDYGSQMEGDGALYIDRIRAATRRLSHRMDALLALSRATQREMACAETDLSALFAEAFARFAQREPERQVTVHIEPALKVRADPDLCAVLVENLAGNAWKFTRDAPAEIRFERTADGQLCLRDNGCGFSPTYAERIFVAFGRYHTSTEFEGTGIGLTTVQRIVHRHGGTIRAEGQVGEGAAFFFSLPAIGCCPKHT
jgi:signal transduction histidine kinase